MVSNPAKVLGLTTGALMDVYFKQPCLLGTNTQMSIKVAWAVDLLWQMCLIAACTQRVDVLSSEVNPFMPSAGITWALMG